MLLDKVVVLEYCHTIAGAYCGKQLADLGAEVIKIEKPITGDESRKAGPFPRDIPDPEKSGLFLYNNTNKKGITLNPSTPAGHKIFIQLVQNSDIIIEDNPPKYMEQIKLNYNGLKQFKPDIIVTSITPFGQTGPYAHYKAYDLNTYQSSGLGYVVPGSDNLDRPPIRQGKYVTEYHAGIGAALVTLGVLFNHGITGNGQHIDFSMQEWEMNLLKGLWIKFSCEGFIPDRRTSEHPFHRAVACKNGFVIFMFQMEHQWARFVEFIQKPEMLVDKKFRDPYDRFENGKELYSIISNWAKDYTMEEIYHRGQKMGVPVGMINKPSDLYSSQQLKEREFFIGIDHPSGGVFHYPGVPYKLSEGSCVKSTAAALLGQHNEEIYCRRLGYSREDMVNLYRVGII